MTHVLSRLGNISDNVNWSSTCAAAALALCTGGDELAVMNWRDNLSPLIKTFRARYKHQNRCHITFYILRPRNISAGQYQLLWHLQVTGDTGSWQWWSFSSRLKYYKTAAVSAVCLYSGYLHWSLMLLPAPATSLICCWSQSVMLPAAALEVEEEKWLLAEPFFLLL